MFRSFFKHAGELNLVTARLACEIGRRNEPEESNPISASVSNSPSMLSLTTQPPAEADPTTTTTMPQPTPFTPASNSSPPNLTANDS
eukprot:CAMPEP_0185781654 /NCGR_PEP_ID=MMETSP1174-20130828/103027_1 /TAXON_ID=35687 /ORGANISM="Dictyocha speculum, Strain CCMP1381" /LENGTH=86 /DNA_ID=CAMNT_0028471709 /DNA_START=12 /DNA_END=272 /DNA_ORIENTATION=-